MLIIYSASTPFQKLEIIANAICIRRKEQPSNHLKEA